MSTPLVVAGLSALLLVATLGEGGATPTATLVVHGAVGLLVALRLVAPRERGLPRSVAIPLGIFVALAIAGAATAPYAFAAWLVLLEIASAAGIAWVAASSGAPLLRALPAALAAGAALHGAWAVAERLLGASRPATTFLNPNHLAAWLVAALLVSSPLAFGRGRRVLAAYAAASGAALAAIALTGSRGALVGLAAGGSALVYLRWGTLPRAARRGVAAAGAVVVLAAALGVAARMSGEDPYRWNRLQIWRASLGEAVEHPVLGSGPGQFAAAAANRNFPLEGERLRFGRSFRTPHSDLLRLPVEFGWPAAAALGAAILLGIGAVRRTRREGTLPADTDGAIAALLALGTQGLFDDLTTRPALLLLAAALAGALLSSPRAVAPASSLARAAAVSTVVLLFVVGEGAPFLAWRAMHDLPRGRLDVAGKARLEEAIVRNPAHPDAWRRLAEHVVGDGEDWNAEGYARAREAAERAIRLEPADAVYRRAAAWVEGMACRALFRDVGTRERAAAHYEEAERLSRYDATIPTDAARFLLGTGDPEGGRRAAERALRIEPEAAVPRALLAEAFLALGDPSRAERLLAEAERLAIPPGEVRSPYEARLLVLDRDGVATLRSRIAEAHRTEGAR